MPIILVGYSTQCDKRVMITGITGRAWPYLKGRACEEDSVRGVVILVEYHCQFTMMIFHTMTLVYNHVLPLELQERGRGKGCGLTDWGLIRIGGVAKGVTKYVYNYLNMNRE